MKPADWVVAAMIALQTVAAGGYVVGGKWNIALYWLLAAGINGTVLWRATH